MKKNLLLLFSFFSLLIAAQQDSFDYILSYESKREKPKEAKKYIENAQIAINTEDPSYFMYIYTDKTTRLFDFKNLYVYHFKGKSTAEDLMSNLKMTGSVKTTTPHTAYYSAIKIAENEYLLQVFDNAKLKKSTQNIAVKLKESPVDLLFVNADIIPHNIYLVSKLKEILDPSKKYVIESSRVDYKNGYLFVQTLKGYKKVKK